MDVPSALAHLIAVNVEYGVLLCVGSRCGRAIRPSGILDHMRKCGRPTTRESRRQMQEYRRGFPNDYDHSTVELPADGLAPQPVIPVVDGFECRKCSIAQDDVPYQERTRTRAFRSQSRKAMKVHGNKAHALKRVADDELFQSVRMQTWFREGKERYWVVDESKQDERDRQIRRATIQDVGEESDESEAHDGDNPDDDDNGDDSQDEIDDQIIQDIEKWKAEAQERRLQALKNVPVVEMDSWHQYTRWNDVLSRSKHNMVKTFQYTRDPDGDDRDDDEPKLCRVMRAWSRILERCLDTLAATDHKDALKWWASPKNEAADQRPFELPQNAKSVAKYSKVYEGMICYMMRTAPKEHWEDETGR
jgi:Orsellinic acid/F9775 biosynthesis cluster protein D